MSPTDERSLTFSSGIAMHELGERIRLARTKQHLSQDELATRAAISRSMLSEVERGAKVPSVLLLDKIATALGSSIARLLDDERTARVIVKRRDEQDVAREETSWERRILSPVLPGIEFEFMRTTLGPHVDAGVFSAHAPGSREYVAVESGTLSLTLDGTPYRLGPGDSIYYAGDCAHAFANTDDEPCVYYLAMDVTGHPGGAGRHRHSPEAKA